MPATLAEKLKPILRETIVTPIVARHPFLADGLSLF
jgi:hypothetical protein